MGSFRGRPLEKKIKFKRKNQVITRDAKSSVKLDGAPVRLDPLLLFQRLVVTAKALDDVEGVFKYSYSPALFEDHLLFTDPQKPVLADAIWTLVNASSLPS